MRSFHGLLILALACGGNQPGVSPPFTVQSPVLVDAGTMPGVASLAASQSCSMDPDLTAVDKPLFEQGQAALASGALHQARSIFAHLMNSYRTSKALLACYNQATDVILKAQDREAFNRRVPKALATPPAERTSNGSALAQSGLPAATPTTLLKSSDRPNKITDIDAWYAENKLRELRYDVPSAADFMFLQLSIFTEGVPWPLFESHTFQPWAQKDTLVAAPLPAAIPSAYGSLPLSSAIQSGDDIIAGYGAPGYALSPYLAVFQKDGKLRAFVDLRSYAYVPSARRVEVNVGTIKETVEGKTVAESNLVTSGLVGTLELRWAQTSGDVLYVQHWHNGYTKEVKGQTGYLSAIDLKSGALLWRSAAQTGNAQTFVLNRKRGVLVTAYGFTAEPRHLYVLDAASGAVLQKTQVAATPSVLIEKDDMVYLRGYDRDYTWNWK
jgi:hypothetical protein